MKKILCVIAATMMMVPSMMAQQKGEMAVGGSLGFSGGTSSSKVISKVGDATSKSDLGNTPSGSFSFGPEFSYFVIDNLQLNAGFRYDLDNTQSKDNDEKNYVANNGSHKYMFGIGLNYFLKICNNFYYTPGFYYDFGGATFYSHERVGSTKENVDKSGFATGIELQLGKFEVKISKHFGLDLNILDLNYDYVGLTEKNKELDAKSTIKVNDIDFRLGSHIGLKYYF